EVGSAPVPSGVADAAESGTAVTFLRLETGRANPLGGRAPTLTLAVRGANRKRRAVGQFLTRWRRSPGFPQLFNRGSRARNPPLTDGAHSPFRGRHARPLLSW